MVHRIRKLFRSIIPEFVLNRYRRRKKRRRKKALAEAMREGKVVTSNHLVEDLRKMGIHAGETLLVHSSMSKVGYLEGGPATFVKALLQVVGAEGNILMPSSPTSGLTKDYMETNPVFDIRSTPSQLGAITEYFRSLEGVVRSFHPTEPVCAVGPMAEYFTQDHFGQITPYNSKSPFYRITEMQGKILYVGVTLDNAGTNLHVLEDAVDFKFPIYDAKTYDAQMVDADGNEFVMRTKVHNPAFSKKRKCDSLIPMFEYEGAMVKTKLGQADCLLFDSRKMLDIMIEKYEGFGVTMYTPRGSK